MTNYGTKVVIKLRELTDTYNLDTIENFNEKAIVDGIEDIYKYIPSEASKTTNQLADKEFVNSSIQTSTAYYRGVWNNWSSVPTDTSSYPEDPKNNKKPTNNDYMVVTDASDYSGSTTLEGTWRFKYTGSWDTKGKSGWAPEYRVNEKSLTAAQIAAIDSGITASLVTSYNSHLLNTSNPHTVTKEQIGLGNCDNTSDVNKPVSSAVQTELNKKLDKTTDIESIQLVTEMPATKNPKTLYFVKE